MVVRKARITPSTFGYYRNALLDEMDKRGIKQMLSTVSIEFTADGLVCEKATDDKGTPGGERLVVRADTYMYSFGMEPNSELAGALAAAAEEVGAKVFNIGNSNRRRLYVMPFTMDIRQRWPLSNAYPCSCDST